jgi:TPR repeat protein
MKYRDNLIRSLALAALATVMLWGTLAAQEPPKVDSSTTLEQLKSLSSQGNADAMMVLGERMIQGEGIEKAPEEGLKLLQQAAEAGKKQAWYDLGVIFANGVAGQTDMAKAMDYFRKGAEAGDADCQTSLGMFYQAGDRIPSGVKADPVEAVKWYRLAAEQNHTEAIQHLGMIYVTGQGVTQDVVEGAKWFMKGAELGNADCWWGLGQCYWEGKGVQKDMVQGLALFSAAVDGTQQPQQKQAMSERRDQLAKELTPEQLKEAERQAAGWKSKGNK